MVGTLSWDVQKDGGTVDRHVGSVKRTHGWGATRVWPLEAGRGSRADVAPWLTLVLRRGQPTDRAVAARAGSHYQDCGKAERTQGLCAVPYLCPPWDLLGPERLHPSLETKSADSLEPCVS